MSRVEWSRRTPDEVENVISFMLCREFAPKANRIKSSQGDGGIDVRVPSGSGIDVYQVKSFTGNINSSRLRQIKHSFETLLAFAEEEELHISRWFLVVPENPTKEQLKWLEHLTSAADFPCSWRGLDFVEGLVAKYPDVIDYYLHDGKDRLEAKLQLFLSVAGRTNPVSSPAASQQTLEDIHESLNTLDPHYRYDFSVTARDSGGRCPPVPGTPGTVGIVQVESVDRCVTYHIIARCDEALKERPVPGSLTLRAERGTDEERKIEDWIKFGVPFKNIPAENVRIDLPGGFGAPMESALVSVGPSVALPGVPTELTLQTIEADGTPIAQLDFVVEEVAAGIDRNGVWAAGHDKATGAVRYEHRAHQGDNASTMNLSTEGFTGRSPADLVPVVRFLNTVRPPLRLQLSVRNGPPLTPPWQIPSALMDEQKGQLWLRICQDLATIQEHVFERIHFPDISKHSWEEVEGWSRAAALLRGEQIEATWTEIPLHLHPGHTMPAVDQTGALTRPLMVLIGDASYELGTMLVQMATVRVDDLRSPVEHGDHSDVWLVPGDDNSAVMRLATGDSQPPPAPQPPGASH